LQRSHNVHFARVAGGVSNHRLCFARPAR
jgi:hypothetical protein